MSRFSKLIGMASKALDKSGSRGSGQGSTDWRSMVRSAADALTGDGRSDTPARPRSYDDPSGAPAPYAPTPPPVRPSSGPAQYTPPPARRASGPEQYAPPPAGSSAAGGSQADRAAIARYDYLLQTAPPERIEQINREAFSRLTADQRAQVLARMRTELPPGEQPRSADPSDLARSATRGEMLRPGSLRGLLARAGGSGRGGGMGRLAGGAALGAGAGLLAAVAGGAVVSAVAAPLLNAASGIDFDAIGANLDLEGLVGGFDGVAGDLASGLGDQVSGIGDQIGGFDIPGLGDFFGR